MQLKEMVIAAQYRISESSGYLWKCYGENATFMDFSFENIEASCVFDKKNQHIYEACLYIENRAYRILDKKSRDDYFNECFKKELDPRIYGDTKHFEECEQEMDFLQKVEYAFTTGRMMPHPETSLNDSIFLNQKSLQEKHQSDRLWVKLGEELNTSGIALKLDLIAPLHEDAYDNIKNKLIGCGKPHLNLEYSNKLVREGLCHTLQDDEIKIDYFL